MAMTPKSFITGFSGDTEVAGTPRDRRASSFIRGRFRIEAEEKSARASAAFGGRLRLWYTIEEDRRWEDRQHHQPLTRIHLSR